MALFKCFPGFLAILVESLVSDGLSSGPRGPSTPVSGMPKISLIQTPNSRAGIRNTPTKRTANL